MNTTTDYRINGTDASTIMGANKYSSAYELWLIKTGRQDRPDLTDKESVQWGIRLEDIILQQTAKEAGIALNPASKQVWLENTAHGFPMTGYADYYDGEYLIEIKTASEYLRSDWEAGVPDYYYWQVVHYMIAASIDRALVACLVGGQTLLKHWVYFSADDARALIEAEAAFYQLLITDTEPQMPVIPEPATVDMDIDVERLCGDYLAINAQIKALEAEKKNLHENLTALIGENQSQNGMLYKASYKHYTRNALDTNALQAKEPDIYQKYITTSGYYKLDVKELKK